MKPRSLRFTWSMKTTSSRDPNEIMTEIRKVRCMATAEGGIQVSHCGMCVCPANQCCQGGAADPKITCPVEGGYIFFI